MRKLGFLNSWRAELDKLNPVHTWLLFIAYLGVCITIFGFTTHYIHLLSQEAQVAEGRLESVYRDWRSTEAGIVVVVDGMEYTLERPTYTKRSYGLKAENLEEVKLLQTELQGYIGSLVRVEYIQMAKKSRTVLEFTIGKVDYMDGEQAREDHINHQLFARKIGGILLVICLAGFIPILVYLHKRRKENE